MPASSIGALNSWGTYLVASLALLLLISPALAAASRGSREGVDLRNTEGVGAVLSSLTPGVSVRFSFGSSASADPIVTQGHELLCSYGDGQVEIRTATLLANATLRPTTLYLAYVSNGAVVIEAV